MIWNKFFLDKIKVEGLVIYYIFFNVWIMLELEVKKFFCLKSIICRWCIIAFMSNVILIFKWLIKL